MILSLSVISIIVTAPIGAILINTLGPMWLDRIDPNEETKEVGEDEKPVEAKFESSEKKKDIVENGAVNVIK